MNPQFGTRQAKVGTATRGRADESTKWSVVVAEDSLLLREGIVRLLEAANLNVVAKVADADALIEAVEAHEPDVVLTDIKMPPSYLEEGLEAAEVIKDRHPSTGVLVMSQYVEPRYAISLMNAGGGVGYLLKDRLTHVEDLVSAVRRVAEGGNVVDSEVVTALLRRSRTKSPLEQLTSRERDILALMAEGRSNAQLCEELFLSPKTVETHISNVFGKLQLHAPAEGHRRVLAVLAFLRS